MNLPSLACCLTLMVGMPLSSGIAIAQVTPDSSLNTQVESQGNVFNVTGGTTAGSNLFHSFSEFSIPQGSEAFFNNSPGLNNIISRVTGGNLSDIQGSIRSAGTANFFLINPAGIVFGESASLNVGGSFFATTGDRLLFADGLAFEANPAAEPPLLSMSVPAGVQFGASPGSIVNRSRTLNARGTVGGLQVAPGQALVLLGGDVQLEGGSLNVPVGSVHVGGIRENGTVLFAPTSTGLELDYSGVTAFSNVTLSNQASIDTSGPRSGRIGLQGDTVQLTSGAVLLGINTGDLDGEPITLSGRHVIVDGGSLVISQALSSGSGAAIEVRGTEAVDFVGIGYEPAVEIFFGVLTQGLNLAETPFGISSSTLGSGDSGTITVETQRLQLLNGAFLATVSGSTGNSGDVIFRASESVTAIGSIFGTTALTPSTGDGGGVTVQTPRLALQDGSQINASIFGTGDGSGVLIETDILILADFRTVLPPLDLNRLVERAGIATGIANATLGTGMAGDIIIRTNVLEASSGSRIQTNSSGDFVPNSGRASNIDIQATERVVVRGVFPEDGLPTSITTFTNSQSAAGDLTVTTGRLVIEGGGSLQSDTFGPANAGQIMVTASEGVEITGTALSPFLQREVTSTISSSSIQLPGTSILEATGNAGQVTVTTPDLRLSDRGSTSAFSLSQGDAGTLIFDTDTLRLENGGSISAATAGGNGGQLLINARNGIILTGQSEIRSTAAPTAIGLGGGIQIDAGFLSLTDSTFAANSQSPNVQGGDIVVNLRGPLQLVRSGIDATTIGGDGGEISLRADESLILRDNSFISTTAGLEGSGGNGGNITLTTPLLVGFPTEDSDITANAFTGDGGSIQIQADTILGLQPRSSPTAFSDITASSEFGLSGEITITDFTVEPDRGLLGALPTLLDASQIVVLGCSDTEDNQFVATGRGGIPPNPSQLVESDRPWQDLRDLSGFQQAVGSGDHSRSFAPTPPVEWPLEARGWQQTDSGATVLSAALSSSDPTFQASNRKCLAKS